jgi:FdrA protein
VVVLLSKPPDSKIAKSILASAQSIGKPVVVCFLGLASDLPAGKNVLQARTLEEAAFLAIRLAGLPEPTFEGQEFALAKTIVADTPKFVRGLFSGGTLAYEAMLILTASLGPIYSNAPLDHACTLEKGQTLAAHTILDLGTEDYTCGVAHPMIDGRFRSELIAEAGSDPLTRVILLDVILGLGSDANPAAAIAPGIRRALAAAAKAGRDLSVVVSVTGTQKDPQGYDTQVASLKALGVDVCQSNAAAARRAARLVCA